MISDLEQSKRKKTVNAEYNVKNKNEQQWMMKKKTIHIYINVNIKIQPTKA